MNKASVIVTGGAPLLMWLIALIFS